MPSRRSLIRVLCTVLSLSSFFSFLCRLQTGMRQAYGKPTGTVARVEIGQIIFSVRSKEANEKQVIEALRRAKYKFPGRQNIIVSNAWGFTHFTRAQYEKYRSEGRIEDRGAHSVLRSARGPINEDAILVQ